MRRAPGAAGGDRTGGDSPPHRKAGDRPQREAGDRRGREAGDRPQREAGDRPGRVDLRAARHRRPRRCRRRGRCRGGCRDRRRWEPGRCRRHHPVRPAWPATVEDPFPTHLFGQLP
ncbi:hypothetical protein C6361_12570 [Plantactinospora sp. BC1]|nr:hypothetical protein C6361_12570 [Plantactinospora sp. BC1]